MKERLQKSIKRLEKSKVIKEKKHKNFEKSLSSTEIKVFRELRDKYDLSFEINSDKNKYTNETELTESAKITLERIKKGESSKV